MAYCSECCKDGIPEHEQSCPNCRSKLRRYSDTHSGQRDINHPPPPDSKPNSTKGPRD